MPPFAYRRSAALLALAALLTACGGGSDDDDDAGPATPPGVRPVVGAEGRWAGRTSTGYDVLLTILDTGETWGLYHTGPIIHGAFHGTSGSSDGQLRGSAAMVDYDKGGQVHSSLYGGSYVPQRQLQAGFVFDVFNGSYVAAYERPATTAAVAGSYTGYAGGWPHPLTLTITPDGGLGLTPASTDCLVRGSIGPRPGGRAVYDMRAAFTGPGCPLPHGTSVAGIAVLDGPRLTITSVAPSLVDVFAFQGHR